MDLATVQALSGMLLGAAIALFHRPVADFMLQQERELDMVFRSRGVKLPPPPTQSVAQDLYFCLGVMLALFEMLRLWLLLR
jgi:hypothetical protein